MPQKTEFKLTNTALGLILHNAKINSSSGRIKEFALKNEHEYLRELYEKGEGKCAITGVKISGEGLNKASLDRIDSNKGYIKGNVQ